MPGAAQHGKKIKKNKKNETENDEDDEECLVSPNTVALDLAELKHVIALTKTRGVPVAAQHGSP